MSSPNLLQFHFPVETLLQTDRSRTHYATKFSLKKKRQLNLALQKLHIRLSFKNLSSFVKKKFFPNVTFNTRKYHASTLFSFISCSRHFLPFISSLKLEKNSPHSLPMSTLLALSVSSPFLPPTFSLCQSSLNQQRKV